METTLKDYLRYAQECNLIPVTREVLCDMETPVAVFGRFCDRPNAFLLESVEGGEQWGRYSFIGVDPELMLEIDHGEAPRGPGSNKSGEGIFAKPSEVPIAQSLGTKEGESELLSGLRGVYKGVKPAPAPGLPRFIGGAVGFISYEASGEFERLPPPKLSVQGVKPVSRFLRVDKLIVFDNLRHTIQIVVCSRPEQEFRKTFMRPERTMIIRSHCLPSKKRISPF